MSTLGDVSYEKLLLLKDTKTYIEQLEKAKEKLQKNAAVAAKLQRDIPLFRNHILELRKEKAFYLKHIRDVEADVEDTSSLIQSAITSRRTALANVRKLQKDIEALEAKIEDCKSIIGVPSMLMERDSDEDNEGLDNNEFQDPEDTENEGGFDETCKPLIAEQTWVKQELENDEVNSSEQTQIHFSSSASAGQDASDASAGNEIPSSNTVLECKAEMEHQSNSSSKNLANNSDTALSHQLKSKPCCSKSQTETREACSLRKRRKRSCPCTENTL